MVRDNVKLRRDQGFTLLEALIAILIMGLMVSALLTIISQNTRFLGERENRVLANIVADNLMVETLADPSRLAVGVQEGEMTLGERQWNYEQITAPSTIERVISITIRVRPANSTQVLAEITTLKNQGGV